VGDPPDPLATRVVDADLRADVALRVDVDPSHVPALAEERLDPHRIVKALVVERDDQPRRLERPQELGQCGGRLAA